LIEERTGAKPGTVGGFFTLNRRVDDLPDRFSVAHRGVRLLEMGAVDIGGSGCICPESAMLKTLFTAPAFPVRNEVLKFWICTPESSIWGAPPVDFVDAMLVVAEPTRRSLGTAAPNQEAGHRHRPEAALAGWQQGTQRRRSCFSGSRIARHSADRLSASLAGRSKRPTGLGIAVYDHVPGAARGPLERIAAALLSQLQATP